MSQSQEFSCLQSLSGLDRTLNDSFQVTTFAANGVVDEVLDKLDIQLAALEFVACIFKRRRNALVRVARLPSDILCNIFEYTRNADLQNSAGNLMGWVNITHVCTAWRSVALNFPAFWSNIRYAYGPNWVQEMLHRSQPAPLHIIAGTSRFKITDFAAVDLSHFVRTKELVVLGKGNREASGELTGHLRDILTSTMPLLERLCIKFSGETLIELPSHLFRGGIPSLRSLELQNCAIRWKNSPFLINSLTSLKISFPFMSFPFMSFPPRSPGARMEEIVSILKNMPDLEILELHDVLRPVDARARPCFKRTVDLLHLTFMHIESVNIQTCGHLLDHLILSPLTSIRLECRRAWNVDDIRSLARSLTYWRYAYQYGEADPFVTLGCVLDDDEVVFKLHTTSGNVQEPQLHVALMDIDERDVFRVTDAFLTALPLEKLRTLHVRNFPASQDSSWLRCFGAFHNLETIGIDNTDAGFLQALTSGRLVDRDASAVGDGAEQQGETKQRKGSLTFPALSRLQLSEPNFKVGYLDTSNMETFERLKGMLRKRKGQGQGIITLDLRLWRFCSVEEVKELEQVVDEVIWDGRKLGDLDSDFLSSL